MLKIKDVAEYEKVYRERILSKLAPQKIFDELRGAVLLCYEKYDDILSGKSFCHRRIVAGWLEDSLGIKLVD